MKMKLLKKYFITTTLIIVITLLSVSVILCFFLSNHMTRQKQGVLKENCEAIAGAVKKSSGKITSDENSALFRTISKVTEADIFITDINGNVVFCSCYDWSIDGTCNHNASAVPQNIMSELQGGSYSETGNLEGILKQPQFTYASLLFNSNNEKIGAVFSTISFQNIKNFYVTVLKLFLFSAAFPIIIMFFAEYYFSYRLVRPLRLMSKAAQSMAKGDFSKRIPVTGNDEISELAVAFNQMTNSLVQIESTRRKFIANVSHELKTPMTTIGGFIDGIIDGTIPPERQNYYLNIVSSETKRLSRLVQSMLSLAKLESGEQKINSTRFDVYDMLISILVSQEQRIKTRKIEIEGLEDLSPTNITADYDLIYQVVYNLVDNAVKFTNEGGTIMCGLKLSEKEFSFSIKNTGEGIEQKDLPFVFDRFYKTDKSRSAVKESTGLGLYLANTIIKIHGGRFSVESVKNQFTEFIFTIPQNNQEV